MALATVVAAIVTAAAASAGGTGFLDRAVRVAAASHSYKVYVPPGFDPSRKWPVILFLHGAGEAGSDGVRHTEVGLGRALRDHPERFPAVVVFPQAPRGEVWLGERKRIARAALDAAIAEFHGDPDRILLAGLSLGAYGSWVLAAEDPSRYAAIVSVAGGVVPPAYMRARLRDLPPALAADDPYAATAARVKDVRAWLFHGAEDATVPVTESRKLVAALKQAGASPRYTEYPGAPHNVWDRAFADPELAEWLMARRRD